MATTITLQGPRTSKARRFFRNLIPRAPHLGDAWSDETAAAAAAAPRPDAFGEGLATAAKSAFGWGILTFAVWTAGLRIAEAWRKG